MKKFLAIVLLAGFIVCGTGCVARAAVHSTEDNFTAAMVVAMTAINATADYLDVMRDASYDVVAQRRQDCESHLATLKNFMSNVAKGKESLDCVLLAAIIMQERGATLQYFLDTMSAYRAGNQRLFEENQGKLRAMYRQAEQSRQEFRAKYGK